MTPSIRRRLMLFALVGAVAVTYTGARYARLTEVVAPSTYQVTVRLAESGGIFPGAEVTYRGVPVGRVGSVVPEGDGISAELKIDKDRKVPADARAAVHNRSAVGEQYVDLVPADDAAPYLHEGSVIDQRSTSTPLPEQELLSSLDRFVTSVNTHDLQTVVRELGTGFRGTGPSIQRLLDSSTTLVDAATKNLPETIGLLRGTATVLGTQQDQASSLRAFTADLAALTGTVAKKDPQLRQTLSGGVGLAREISRLLTELEPSFGGLLNNLAVIGRIARLGIGSLEQALVAFPYAIGGTVVGARNRQAQFSLQLATAPKVCEKGYIPSVRWRSTTDLTARAPDYSIACTDPSKNYRGAGRAP